MTTIINKNITAERVREVFHYDGFHLLWKNPNPLARCAKVGEIAGCIKKCGYRKIGVDNKVYSAHILIWLYVHGDWPKDQIDHKNGDKTDNRITNLRDIPQNINNKNTKRRKDNTSGYPGVWWSKFKNKWSAYGRYNNKQYHIGYFDEKWDALCARKSWEIGKIFLENHGTD